MNEKTIENKFNMLYNELYNKYYLELSKIKNEEKKETNIRRLLWVGYAIFIIFSFYLLGIIFENIYSTTLTLIIIFGCIGIWFIVALLIFLKFTKKNIKYYNTYKNTIYKSILENININWKYSSNVIRKGLMDDYKEAKFPREAGGIFVSGMFESNTLKATFFNIEEHVYEGPNLTNYEGVYVSILNNNKISDNIFIRSKEYDKFYRKNPPSPKLDIITSNYNIYSKEKNYITNELIKLINNFYESTGINCDLTIYQNKIQIRFELFQKYTKSKDILNKKELYNFFYKMYSINQFIEDLIKLLSY